jgi:hypothetical protein
VAAEVEITSSDGGTAYLSDLLFGEVALCGGQSNMQYTWDYNGSAPHPSTDSPSRAPAPIAARARARPAHLLHSPSAPSVPDLCPALAGPPGFLDAAAELAAASSYPDIRLLTVKPTGAWSEKEQFAEKYDWQAASDANALNGFSAACWTYGRALRDTLKRPVGLMLAAVGGTSLTQWWVICPAHVAI